MCPVGCDCGHEHDPRCLHCLHCVHCVRFVRCATMHSMLKKQCLRRDCWQRHNCYHSLLSDYDCVSDFDYNCGYDCCGGHFCVLGFAHGSILARARDC